MLTDHCLLTTPKDSSRSNFALKEGKELLDFGPMAVRQGLHLKHLGGHPILDANPPGSGEE